MELKETDPRYVLHSLCSDMEIRSADIPDKDLTQVELVTRTKIVKPAIRFDPDNNGFQHFTLLMGGVSEEDYGIVAPEAIRDPPREVTPVLRDGVFGIQGAKSPLPKERVELESVFLDAFGRITTYVDNDLPKIQRAVEKVKRIQAEATG